MLRRSCRDLGVVEERREVERAHLRRPPRLARLIEILGRKLARAAWPAGSVGVGPVDRRPPRLRLQVHHRRRGPGRSALATATAAAFWPRRRIGGVRLLWPRRRHRHVERRQVDVGRNRPAIERRQVIGRPAAWGRRPAWRSPRTALGHRRSRGPGPTWSFILRWRGQFIRRRHKLQSIANRIGYRGNLRCATENGWRGSFKNAASFFCGLRHTQDARGRRTGARAWRQGAGSALLNRWEARRAGSLPKRLASRAIGGVDE